MMTALITGLKLRCNRSPPAMATNKDNKDNGVKETRKEYIELGTRDPDVIFKDKGILIFHHAAPLTKNELLRILSDSYFAILWILEDSS